MFVDTCKFSTLYYLVGAGMLANGQWLYSVPNRSCRLEELY